MSWPKIVYNAGTGNVTLAFKYPPRNVPASWKTPTRTDTFSTAGVKQSIVQRIDEFLSFTMALVLSGTDISAWQSFMDWALTGGSFEYYPDASSATHTDYTLEDTDWQAAYKSPGAYTFSVKFRKVVS